MVPFVRMALFSQPSFNYQRIDAVLLHDLWINISHLSSAYFSFVGFHFNDILWFYCHVAGSDPFSSNHQHQSY